MSTAEQAAREAQRAERLRTLDDALRVVRLHEVDALSARERDTLTAAALVVADLIRVW